MFNIQTLNKISPAGLDLLNPTKYAHGDEVSNPDAIMVRSAAMHDMAFGDNLKAIARAGAGTNNIPVDKCAEQGIVVFNTPGANANAVKELVLAAILMSSRKIVPGIEWVQSLKGQEGDVSKLVEKGKSKFAGPEIKGKKLGVIGLGAIGVLVANAAAALGMTVYGYDPYISIDGAWSLSTSVIRANTLKEIYENSDYITMHIPATSETKGMINASSIDTMKHGVRILNFSRGELVNNEDMITALEEKKVTVYMTDFAAEELLGNPGIIITPHLGASTPESEDNCAAMAARELVEFLENGNIKNSVNYPTVDVPRTTAVRIGVLHKNVPNMLTQMSGMISEGSVNIEAMISKAKKDFSYAIFDISTNVSDAVIGKIKALDGVIRVFVFNK